MSFRTFLDRDVYQAIKKIESAYDGEKPFNKSVSVIYEAIKRSNSSLGRQKKRPLEDAIERALQILKQEQQDSDDSEAAIDEPTPPKASDDGFLLNRQLTKLWKMDQHPPKSGEQSVAKKRRIQIDARDNDEPKAEPATIINGSGSAATTALAPSTQAKVKAKAPQRSSRYIIEQPVEPAPFAGYDDIFVELQRSAGMFLRAGHLFGCNEERSAGGIVISGPLGIGKKILVRNVAASLAVPLVSVARCFWDPERIEKSLSEAFDTAISLAPSIIFIEHLDRCMPRSTSSIFGEPHSRAACFFADQMARICHTPGQQGRVLVLATTSQVTDINPEILGFGLISTTVQMRIPDSNARRDILKALTQHIQLADDVNLDELAKSAHGYVASDLAQIVLLARRSLEKRMASAIDPGYAMPKLDTQLAKQRSVLHMATDFFSRPITSSPIPVLRTMEDFKIAMKDFTPSLRKDGFTVVPSVTWDQVGALDEARKQLQTSIIGPIKNSELYKTFGLTRPAGVLLWGPPGCGKTLIAQAVANEAQASFILIDGPELLNKYVGESERAVRELFQRARSSTPCILFFDEIDSIVPPRQKASTESGARVVNALLAELDGVKDRTGVYVIGTTNRPEMIDEAILRHGRLSVHLLVDLPTAKERVDILQTIYRTRHEDASDEALDRLAAVALDARCTNFSGADLGGLHIKAAEHALEEWLAAGGGGPRFISDADWEFALANTRASIKHPASYKSRTADSVGKQTGAGGKGERSGAIDHIRATAAGP